MKYIRNIKKAKRKIYFGNAFSIFFLNIFLLYLFSKKCQVAFLYDFLYGIFPAGFSPVAHCAPAGEEPVGGEA
jgi:hypothetical protein